MVRVAIERTYYCESPDCGGGSLDGDKPPAHCQTATPPPYLPPGFIEVRLRDDGEDAVHHFCCWDCLTKYAAAQPLPVVIPWSDEDA